MMKAVLHNYLLTAGLGLALAVGPTYLATARPRTLTVTLVTAFDHPNPSYQIYKIGGINERGDIVGNIASIHAQGPFVRKASGNFTTILPAEGLLPEGLGINSAGTICGDAGFDPYQAFIGILLMGETTTTYRAGQYGTTLYAINDHGDFVGSFGRYDGGRVAFANFDGTQVNLPFRTGKAIATGINNRGEVVGYNSGYGYIRHPDGTFTTNIRVPGSLFTVPTGINDSGVISGYLGDSMGGLHGFVAILPSTFVTYDFTGALQTAFTGINSHGEVVGYYRDSAAVLHGLLLQADLQ